MAQARSRVPRADPRAEHRASICRGQKADRKDSNESPRPASDGASKSRSVNGIVHSCLRAMLRDARVDSLVKTDLYDRAFFKPLSITDTSIDPYTPKEREIILEGFRTKRPHYYKSAFFQFWQGTSPTKPGTA
jgi:hypothetical protein